ncbi:MAG: chorismate synthase, partial [Oscillospiraceae bacterium]|nr:chorismate synthase [Oscillospiraceae bacterium]
MSSVFGKNIKISIFGQSHSNAVGVSIDGLPAGERIDTEELKGFLKRRAPGQNPWSTPRREEDTPEILSGLVQGVTCGAPLAAIIRNTDTRSSDYRELRDIPRPGHADYTANVKFGGFQDVAGGGHFSARLTAPLCIAGGICLQLLSRRGIEIGAHIQMIGGVYDRAFDPAAVSPEALSEIREKSFP